MKPHNLIISNPLVEQWNRISEYMIMYASLDTLDAFEDFKDFL